VKVKGWKPITEPLAKATANRDVPCFRVLTPTPRRQWTHAPAHFHTHNESDNVREGSLETAGKEQVLKVTLP
jgi:hypothetical protein